VQKIQAAAPTQEVGGPASPARPRIDTWFLLSGDDAA
jgi:hypothetical protein